MSKTWELYWTTLADARPAPFFSTVATRSHVVGAASAVKPEFVAHQYVRLPVQTMMVEMMSDLVVVCDKKNSCEKHHENENS